MVNPEHKHVFPLVYIYCVYIYIHIHIYVYIYIHIYIYILYVIMCIYIYTERGVVSAKKNEILEIYSLDTMDGFMFFALTTACVSRTNHLIY